MPEESASPKLHTMPCGCVITQWEEDDGNMMQLMLCHQDCVIVALTLLACAQADVPVEFKDPT